jgi:predicted Zn finger-like uncharacterized protein
MAIFEKLRRKRVFRDLVRDREKLSSLSRGGSPDRPIEVASASVVEVRARSLSCPQCDGHYSVQDHRAPSAGLRAVDVRCDLCGTRRTLWFRLGSTDPN